MLFLGMNAYFFALAFFFVPFGASFRDVVPLMSGISTEPMLSFVRDRCSEANGRARLLHPVLITTTNATLIPRSCNQQELMCAEHVQGRA